MDLRPQASSPILEVLQDNHFRPIWYVGGLNEVSRRMELLVLSWLILQTTNSPFQLGLVLVFNNLPRPFLSLFAGLVADRFSRHRILFVAQSINTLSASLILYLIVSEQIATWHVFLAVFVQGASKALEDPSRRTAIFDIVGDRRLVNALSLDTISNTAGKMIGPLLAGVLLDVSGFSGAYIFALIIHFLALGVLTQVRIPVGMPNSTQAEPVWRSLRVSLGYALHSPMLLGMLYVTIVMNALAFPVQQFIPAVGQYHLHVGATLVGLLVAAEGLGQLAGAGLMALSRDLKHHGRVFFWGSLLVLVMVILFAWSPWYALAFALLTVGGVGQAGFGTMQSAITMMGAPREMRGRMMGLLSVCIGVGTPLGTLEIGALAGIYSTQWALSVNALAGLVLMIPALLFRPLAWQRSAQISTQPAGDLGSDSD